MAYTTSRVDRGDTSTLVGDVVHADGAVGVTSEQIGAVGGPRQGSAVRNLGVLAGRRHVQSDLINHGLGLKIPDLDAGGGGGHQPVAVGGEDQGVDDVTGLENVQALALGQVPKHGNAVLATGGAQGAIGGHGHGVEVASVADQVVFEAASLDAPDLHELVPTGRHHDRGVGGRRESHARHPLGVAILDDGELALTKSVPELHGAIARSGHDLAVVGREGNRQHILGVANEAAGALAGGNLPQAKGGIPRAGKGELAIGTDDNIRHEVVVALQGAASIAVVLLLAGKGPHDDGL
jgi:hypothetical protein